MYKPTHYQEVHMRIAKVILIVTIFAVLWACASADFKKTYTPGDTAYDFTLPDQNGKMTKLSDALKDYRGIVLAFYPKDDTKD
jgi:cytochrome oxidase Cu insertion factor (SCO1/SenC/PrrC family)